MMQSRWRARMYNLIYWTPSSIIRLLFSPIQYREETSQKCHSGTFISQPCITPVNAPRSWRRRCLIHPCSASNSQRYHFWQTLDESIPLWLVRMCLWFISIALLTCLTVFPEMKTALRTYHPVPSLQKSDGNAQDAPRIKNCLKAALLPSELKGVAPSTPEEVLEKQVTKFHSLAYNILNMLTQISPWFCDRGRVNALLPVLST